MSLSSLLLYHLIFRSPPPCLMRFSAIHSSWFTVPCLHRACVGIPSISTWMLPYMLCVACRCLRFLASSGASFSYCCKSLLPPRRHLAHSFGMTSASLPRSPFPFMCSFVTSSHHLLLPLPCFRRLSSGPFHMLTRCLSPHCILPLYFLVTVFFPACVFASSVVVVTKWIVSFHTKRRDDETRAGF